MKDVQGVLRHSRAGTTTDVYMQEIPESIRATVNSIHTELKSGKGKRRVAESILFIVRFYCKRELYPSCAYRAIQLYRQLVSRSPGTMLTALAMHDLTGESRRADLYRESTVALQRACAYQADHACWLWTQDLYGSRVKMIGAVHGFAGNAFALVRGRAVPFA